MFICDEPTCLRYSVMQGPDQRAPCKAEDCPNVNYCYHCLGCDDMGFRMECMWDPENLCPTFLSDEEEDVEEGEDEEEEEEEEEDVEDDEIE